MYRLQMRGNRQYASKKEEMELYHIFLSSFQENIQVWFMESPDDFEPAKAVAAIGHFLQYSASD